MTSSDGTEKDQQSPGSKGGTETTPQFFAETTCLEHSDIRRKDGREYRRPARR